MKHCEEQKRKIISRINRIEGQIKALKKRLESELDCSDICEPYEAVRQMSAIKGAINGMITAYLQHYIKEHMVKNIKNAKDENEALKEMEALFDIVKSFNK